MLDELKDLGIGQNQNNEGQQGQGQGRAGPGQDQLNQLGRAGDAMGEAQDELGQNNADSAVESQGRALDALRKGAQGLAQSMQQQMGQGTGARPLWPLRTAARRSGDRSARPAAAQARLWRRLPVKVPGEIDVQRARRIIEELRKRFGDLGRSQEELDYIERLLKDY